MDDRRKPTRANRICSFEGEKQILLPGQIKGFVLLEPTSSYYEAMDVQSVGIFFFQRVFSDGTLHFFYCAPPFYKNVSPILVFTYRDSIVKADYLKYDAQRQRLPPPRQWLPGNIVRMDGKELKGHLFFNKKSVAFRNFETRESGLYPLDSLRGIYGENFFYKTPIPREPDLIWNGLTLFRILAESPMQLYEGMDTKHNFNTLFSRNYYIKLITGDELIKISARQPVISRAAAQKIEKWFAPYPALTAAVLNGRLPSERAIVHLYNLYRQLGK